MRLYADNINFGILKWARERAALDETEAARKAGLSVNRLKAMESGAKPPTRRQLFKLARIYRRPTITFYSSKPPAKGDFGTDYRRADRDVSKREEALFYSLLINAIVKQNRLWCLVEDDQEEGYSLEYVNSAKGKSAEAVAESISFILGLDHRNAKKRRGNAVDLFNDYRCKAETAGLFVICAGNLGSQHTDLDPEVFRVISIPDKLAPFVAINKNDLKSAWAFNMFHGLAHIWLGNKCISGRLYMDEDDFKGREIEGFCNEVAGEILLPAEALPSAPIPKDTVKAREIVGEIADKWSVSYSMTAYRLFLKGCFESRDTFEQMRSEYRAQWNEAKEKNRNKKGGPNSNRMKRYWLGDTLLDLVKRMLQGEELTHTKAGYLLGVNLARVTEFLRDWEMPRTAWDARAAAIRRRATKDLVINLDPESPSQQSQSLEFQARVNYR